MQSSLCPLNEKLVETMQKTAKRDSIAVLFEDVHFDSSSYLCC